jgi:hypothetical protein
MIPGMVSSNKPTDHYQRFYPVAWHIVFMIEILSL